MSRIIRIGTRDSELALWQAKAVETQLVDLGHNTTLVPIKSAGDIRLDQPLHELGITGIFTKSLDEAMLRGDIDIAVHSMKDVPTVLPEGIAQAAVLKRGDFNDVLVYKNNEEFLAQEHATIATGSLRRRAQWLNRYPTHTIEDLRGNVNSRLQKLKDNDWNGAIFAAAGLKRIGLQPDTSITLKWMIPAPAQGTIMITALSEDEEILAICSELNHKETEICTSTERLFLNLLEGGCTAPIGALAYIKEKEISFKGILLNKDGSKKIEVAKTGPMNASQNLAKTCAEIVIKRGGKRIMNELQETNRQVTIFSTKKLTENQLHLFHDSVEAAGEDFIQISFNRLPLPLLKDKINNVIITSKNAVESILTNTSAKDLKFENIYCVGRRTKRLIEDSIGKVKHTENSAQKLANYLVEYIDGLEVTYFCSDLRLDDLPGILSKNHIIVNEVEAYQTKHTPVQIDDGIQGIMFYSPSTVESYLLKNSADKIAFCIGETTASVARNHFKDVRVAKIPTVESVIELVNEHYRVAE